MAKSYKIAVGIDKLGWYKHFENYLQKHQKAGAAIEYKIVNMDAHDWMEQVTDSDLILWKPHYMGTKSAIFFKEKVYFLQYMMGKKVVPNYETIWHFESKVAQSYIFSHYNIKVPKTLVSMDYKDAFEQKDSMGYPFVLKLSSGASSKNVQLVNNKREAVQRLEETFAVPIYDDMKRKIKSGPKTMLKNISKRWVWFRTWIRLYENFENMAVSYIQEFLPNNQSDLRITVIGQNHAYGFWRNNRPNDFRASGSGLLDYERDIPQGPVKYCLNLNKQLKFDSMCYDFILKDGDYVLTEMSYGYKAEFLYNVPGHFVLNENDELDYVKLNQWPQELWVDWALENHGII